jgi:hypothetical protein
MQIKSLLLASLLTYSLFSVGCIKKEEVVVEPIPDLNTFTFDIQMAYKTTVNPNPKCFIDLDKGVAYDVATAPAHAAEIDLVWHYYGFDQCYLDIPNDNIFSVATDGFDIGELGFGNWSVRNSGVVDNSSTLSKGQVTNIKTAADLTTFLNGKYPIQSEIIFDGSSNTYASVFMFETGQRKKGVLIANSNAYDSNGGRANITVKIQK